MERKTEKLQLLTTQLHDAAIEGDVPSLLNLLQEDPFILDRCTIEKSSHFIQSPLHVAAKLGHSEFTKEILSRKPELAEELDQLKRSSPLHMASAKGHLHIVQTLLAVNPNMCIARDQDGRNPVHAAAINGHVHVLDELLQAKPQAARERTNEGETVLHLCVKHNQPEALKCVVNVADDGELLNSKDSDGSTVLHLAVAAKQPEIVKFLLKNKRMGKNEINKNGSTAMDILIQSRKDTNDWDIWRSLKRAKALGAKNALKPKNKNHDWLENQRSALMVVASLIATMAFQVGTNPPGGSWQDDSNGHNAGFSIMADVNKGQYDTLLIYNTVGLVSSLSVLLLLISGLPCKRLFVIILMITMWVAVTATTLTYVVSIDFLSPYQKHHAIGLAVTISLYAWLSLMLILLLAHASRFTIKLTKNFMQLVKEIYSSSFRRGANHPPV